MVDYMGIDVSVVRVFTNADSEFGNPLGILDAATVPVGERQAVAAELGYSETIFIDLPKSGAGTTHAQIFTPATELPFAGHPTVGAAWWLRERGTPIRTLQVRAGIVQIRDRAGLTAVVARSEWGPEFAIHEVDSVATLAAAAPSDFPDDIEHYLWTWVDRDAGHIRSRMFATNLGVPEDEATGSAAIRITDHLSRDLSITQGKGSQLFTVWNPEGWVEVAGRVVSDGIRRLG